MRSKTVYLALVLLVLLAAFLRSYALGEVALRGDEAFTARFWAQDLLTVWDDLAGWEPHPLGTFVMFWAWSELLGDSEFALRSLPLLVNLIGVALMMALGRRLLGAWRLGVWVGLLWALNPFLVWHAQDARNYALWAVVSPLAMWLLLIALKRKRRVDWFLYGVAATLALYTFLLEPFFLLVGIIFVLWYRRESLRPALLTWAGVGLACLPLLVQLVRLAGADYDGTADGFSLTVLLQRFLPTLLFGDGSISTVGGLGLVLVLLVGLLLGRKGAETRHLLLLWVFVPIMLLCLASLNLNVFRPRYIIPVTVPLLLALLTITHQAKRTRPLSAMVMFVLVSGSFYALYDYYFLAEPKAPDWRGAARYLETRAGADDLVVLGNTDPAFRYYYAGAAHDKPFSEIGNADELLSTYEGVFIQNADATFDLSRRFEAEAQFVPPASAVFKHYRSYEPALDEMQMTLDVTVGDVAILRGYTIFGDGEFGTTVYVYWEPLRQTDEPLVGFVHALVDGALVEQDDHVPLNGNASTIVWQVGDFLRDVYFLPLDYEAVELIVGMYDPRDNERLPMIAADGEPLGDHVRLAK